ncbi:MULTISPECIES: heme-binding domain-containing protein [Maribacter]|uniref:Cytochrome C n=1 Tax=Maribacter flavus TaxID=1658664 RepID=A0A5B2TTJ5_9FLAO|nr:MULTISPECIES: heme-binding domain-containing protein [Maribacter]KAA2216830.1 cytochrome C [Maribacter flavus]MDC6406030.1 heme-binding domain-containing protein [Maribacter sp. PR66]MEE1973185.1 heme-binding domain-containing protein [Maribacter flavus]
MKLIRKILIGLLVVFIAIQFYRPEKNLSKENDTAMFLRETNPPEEVRDILQNSCFDCHSNNTVYPWYNNIAPVSFWLADHIEEGKSELNFSEWETYSDKKKDHKLEELYEETERRSMPLKEYTWTHKEAKLTEAQIEAVVKWAKDTRSLYQLGNRPK